MAIANPTTVPHAKIAAASTGARWNQFYPVPDIDMSIETLSQFQDLGTKAIIITVDQQVTWFERDQHNRNLGGVVRDVVTQATGAALSGYLVVFSIEALMLLIATFMLYRIDVNAFAKKAHEPTFVDKVALVAE